MRKFEYLQPQSLEESIEMLERYGQEAKLIAGGTDLLIQMEKKGIKYPYLIGLKQLPGLSYIKEDPEQRILRIGAMTLIQDIADSTVIKAKFSFLADACAQLGSFQVRNIATLGGNLCNAAPSAEAAPSLLTLEGRAVIMGSRCRRVIPLEQFFRGPGQTSLARDEILFEIEIPYIEAAKGVYQKLAHRRALDIAVVNIAILMRIAKNEICEFIRLILGAVAPVPLRAREAEKLLTGKRLEEGLIEAAAHVASEEASPITDVRGTAEYRKSMIKVLVSRAIREIWGNSN